MLKNSGSAQENDVYRCVMLRSVPIGIPKPILLKSLLIIILIKKKYQYKGLVVVKAYTNSKELNSGLLKHGCLSLLLPRPQVSSWGV